jgi:uncharacterized protein YecE (DUF72 family)
MFYIGCPVWGYKDWVGKIFPARTPASEFLRLYSQQFNTVEGNTTFYATPSIETITRWVRQTPAIFRFCPKVSRSISHTLQLDRQRSETLFFIERLRGLGTRLGPMFLQLPPSFAPDQLTQLQTFLAFWPTDVRLAVEVRHPDFYKEPYSSTLNTLLKQHHTARVIMDTRPIRVGSTQEQQLLQARERKPNLPLQTTITTDFMFVRYIGHPRMDANEPFLIEWAQRLGEWLKLGLTLYVFCHCPFEEHSPSICTELYQKVRTLVPLPALPEHSEKMGFEQGRLF